MILFSDTEADQSRKEIKSIAKQLSWYVFAEEINHSRSYLRSVREQSAISATRYAQRNTIFDTSDQKKQLEVLSEAIKQSRKNL